MNFIVSVLEHNKYSILKLNDKQLNNTIALPQWVNCYLKPNRFKFFIKKYSNIKIILRIDKAQFEVEINCRINVKNKII